ncbi:hypothetical protein AKJ65_08150 [candidate division MSBL1 archaeon SCGC-AAA259E19]|uniref:Uncharacterized protein n=1 Tax=candidate division MSBL1 archaeon SCGC-AAA259E19 TaxID=1698264 RepID=A0A133UCY8_9EURY|nr:hypothetical protein AKJ65_08150 [candidate division MSBL1 archaeon SCGC-AAA259E19]
MVKEFVDNDNGYLAWIRNNPTGFVINAERNPSKRYLKLHKATCGTITSGKRENWTRTQYMKICSQTKEELANWAERKLAGKLDPCRICNP